MATSILDQRVDSEWLWNRGLSARDGGGGDGGGYQRLQRHCDDHWHANHSAPENSWLGGGDIHRRRLRVGDSGLYQNLLHCVRVHSSRYDRVNLTGTRVQQRRDSAPIIRSTEELGNPPNGDRFFAEETRRRYLFGQTTPWSILVTGPVPLKTNF